jgi:hypothetical protein
MNNLYDVVAVLEAIERRLSKIEEDKTANKILEELREINRKLDGIDELKETNTSLQYVRGRLTDFNSTLIEIRDKLG